MAESNGKDYVIGVKIGATKISCGLFDTRLTMLRIHKVSTKADRGAKTVVERVARCVKDAVDECDLTLKRVRAIGIGAPGTVDAVKGDVIFAHKIGWENVALGDNLESQLQIPVLVENDCNLCTLAVYVQELKSKPRNLIGIFIGSGIGGGMIIGGDLFSGYNHAAGEIGHMVLHVGGPKCGCGNQGCFETLASRRGILRRIEAAVKDGQKTVLTEMVGEDLKDLRSGDLRKALSKGDRVVEKAVEETARCIGAAVGNLINLINPEVVTLGGGVISALESELLPTIRKTAREHTMRGTANGIEVFATQLGDDAGIIGGAILARRNARENGKG